MIVADWPRLAKVALPAIAECNAGGFLIVARVADDNAVVQVGGQPRLLNSSQFQTFCSGRFVLLTRRASLRDLGRRFDISWFLQAMQKYRRLLGEVLVASFFLQLFGLISPLFFQVVTDKALVHRGYTTLDVLVIGLVTVAIFETVLGALRTFVFSHTTNRIDVELGARLHGCHRCQMAAVGLRSHMYPPAIAELPWSDSLIAAAGDLQRLRARFFDACQRRYAQGEGLAREIQKLQLRPLRTVYRSATTNPLIFSPEFEDGEDFVLEMGEPTSADDQTTIPLSLDGHAITVRAGPLVPLLVSGLMPHNGEEFSRSKLLTLPVPPNQEVAAQLDELVESFSPDRLEFAVEQELDQIDDVVGTALGLTKDEVKFIQREMSEDPFLSRIRPRYPFFTPRQHGRRIRLESSSRYG